ncbi:MAG TPA: hypothetical protein VH419_06595, partial [Nocardioidaceae bacterium]
MTDSAAETAHVASGWRVVQRTIIRPDQELDIRPLYVTGLSGFGGAASTARQSGEEIPDVERQIRGKGIPANLYDDSADEGVEALGAFGTITEAGAVANAEH